MSNYAIHIPETLINALSGDRCARLVQQVLEEFSDFIARNEMVFFRQYTDHGPRHIEDVLETARALMTVQSLDLVTPEDVCVLITATVLHDSALHLQEPGFLALVSESEVPILLPELDSESWTTLWAKYVSEVSRLSQSQLNDTFGVSEPIQSPNLDDPDTWTPLQYAYIGEFIRRHHHRLAHEMALTGLPGLAGRSIFPPRDASDPLLPLIDLSGLVARSHGTAIRPLLPYLARHYHLRRFDSSHPVYLMVLLRIADYLQLQSGRAPNSVFRIKRIRSPRSRREWKVHESIKDILYDEHDDPESVEIIVDPSRTSIDVFLRVQEWLMGIQSELDTSWAVLGEIFGRFHERELGLTIRRIRSNIDNTETFGRDAGFVPCRVSFSAADAELLKLLIKPLYGDRPEIAVRELLQNAVDAVRERWALGEFSEEARSSDVEIHVKKHDGGKWSLIVEDSGIGMTFDTLSNFFLNAGASFRSSMVWKKEFQEDSGGSIVLRSGRFGVGALAAFLLADDPKLVKLKVSTRHIHASEEEGLEFEADLTDRPLTIRHVRLPKPGTRVEVFTSNPPAFMQRAGMEDDKLVGEWDWYCLDSPRVRRVAPSGRELAQSISLPADLQTAKEDYHWISPEGYQSVGWTFGDAPSLVCNGIIVAQKDKNAPSLEETESAQGKVAVRLPSISVYDRDGKLPLTLDRLRVDFERISFLADLRDDVLKNIAAYMVVCAPDDIRESRFNVLEQDDIRSHPAIEDSIAQIPWLLTPRGVSLLDLDLLPGIGIQKMVEIQDPGDISIVADVAKHDRFGIAIAKESLWSSTKKADSIPAIKERRRGVYRATLELDSVDEKRLLEILSLLRHPHRRYATDLYDGGRSLGEKVVGTMSRWLGRERVEPFEFYHEFEREVHRHRRMISRSGDYSVEEMLRDLMSRLDRELSESGRVTSGMLEAHHLIARIDAAEDINEIALTIRRAADAIAGRSSRRRRVSRRDALRLWERLVSRWRAENRHSWSESIEEIMHRLRDALETSRFRNRDVPDYLLEALEILESVSPIERKRLETEGEISTPVIEWEDLAKRRDLRDNWAITEYEIDQSVRIGAIKNVLGRIWREYVGNSPIPYNLEGRKTQLAHLWERNEMKRHLQQWESALLRAKERPKDSDSSRKQTLRDRLEAFASPRGS